jgi:hypothetical protein
MNSGSNRTFLLGKPACKPSISSVRYQFIQRFTLDLAAYNSSAISVLDLPFASSNIAFALGTNGLFGFHCTIFFRRYSACGIKIGNLFMLNAVA